MPKTGIYTIPEGEPCYLYHAMIVCKACGEAARAHLAERGEAPANPDDENTYDSFVYPKGPLPAEHDEACGCVANCLSLRPNNRGAKAPAELSRAELVAVVERVQDVLWFDSDANALDPNKEWEVDFLELIAQQMRAYDLDPKE